jgi:hypothetical protein
LTTALVTLTRPEVKWAKPKEAAFIGKDILELLTSSMYVDPMCLFREYVQNACDAVDLASRGGILPESGKVEIRVDQSARNVTIRDNGAGLGGDQFVHTLTALGGSNKRGAGFRGFRGVGRLSGLSFCHELIFRSRQEGESGTHEIRWDSREVRSALRSADSSQDLRDIITKAVQTRIVPSADWPTRFFEVELKGVVRHGDDRLLNEEAIAGYLGQVAPVEFHPGFEFGAQIRSFLEAAGIRQGTVAIEVAGYGKVFRPHRNSFAIGKKVETGFRKLETMIIPGRDGGVAAAGWVLHHDYRGALSRSSLIEGWRLRAGDIQIGDNDLLQSLFPESRFNAWCVAETHILDPRIVPNGRRDHFEQNAYYFDLLSQLTPHARGIAQRCRTSSIARNVLRALDARIVECEQHLRAIGKGALTEVSNSRAVRQLESTLKQLDRLVCRAALETQRQLEYELRIKRLRQRLLKARDGRNKETIFQGYTVAQRSILKEVFNTIYQSKSNVAHAQDLIDTIVSRLNRTHRKSAKTKPTKRLMSIRHVRTR